MELQLGSTPNGPTRLCRVVVIDDEADLRMLMRVMLRADGRFEVVGEAGNGLDGVAAVAALQPDVVVLDLSMPGMDGLTALALIRDAAPDCAVVVCSAHRDREAQLLAAGADAYVEKLGLPMHLAEVLDEVRHRDSLVRL